MSKIEDGPAFGVWQPIETAPRDGTIILLADRGYVLVGYWGLAKGVSPAGSNKRFPWVTLDETNGVNSMMDGEFGPDHWMPRPKPPADAMLSARKATGGDGDV